MRMSEFQNEFDDEGLGLEFVEEPIIEEPINLESNSIFDEPIEPGNQNNELLDSLLEAKGISNGKITLLDEDNKEQEVDFYSLSKEEQLDILNQAEEAGPDLVEDEVGLLNYIRGNNLTVEQFLEAYKESILQEAGISNEPVYEIDAYDDNELYLLDLQQKFELTDEELEQELQKELANPELFKKKIEKIRSEYKQLEDDYKQAQAQEVEEKREEDYNTLVETMVDVATKTEDFYGLALEDEEKQEVLSYLLDVDQNGISAFYKALNDPNKLYEAAWFLRYGKESFEAIQSAYETEIARLKKDSKPSVVINQNNNKPKSLFDLD
jgi:hypothetical protein